MWISDRSVLFAGDLRLFKGGTPFLLLGSVAGSIEVLEQVVRLLAAVTIVPGHGPFAAGGDRGGAGLPALHPGPGPQGEGCRADPLLDAVRQADLGAYRDLTDSVSLGTCTART